MSNEKTEKVEKTAKAPTPGVEVRKDGATVTTKANGLVIVNFAGEPK